MTTLDIKLLRDVRRLWAQVLAVALVVAGGVATLVLAVGSHRSLEETRVAYYERYGFGDVFAQLKRAPKALADRIGEIPGVAVLDTRIAKLTDTTDGLTRSLTDLLDDRTTGMVSLLGGAARTLSSEFEASLNGIERTLAERGHEFGSTTGRARRCGWFDAVALRRAAQINSVSGLCITKLDVLDGLDTIRICVGYKYDGVEKLVPPDGAEAFANCEPVYVDMPGWRDTTYGVKRYEDLPANAVAYLKRIEEVVEVPIDVISTGPDRDETMVLRHPFK